MIQRRLIYYFVILIGLTILSSGIYIQHNLRSELESELGAKLVSIAGLTASTVEAELLVLLGPGDEDTRTFNTFLMQLQKQKAAADMKRILITTPSGEIWLDTEEQPIGTSYARYTLYQHEKDIALQGKTTSSMLFQHTDGKWYMTGFAPITNQNKIVGLVAVEGSAASLNLIDRVRRNLISIGIVTLVIAILFAGFISRRLTAPIFVLQQASQRIEDGDLETPIRVHSNTEIQDLAKTMEDMRKGILQRDKRQLGMLAGVAHEIRNPLGGIELFGGLLRADLHKQSQQEKLDRIMQETRKIGQIANHFIDFATPIQANKSICDIVEVVEQAQSLCEHKLKQKQISIETSGNAKIFADPLHLRQVFLNLLLNSIDACEMNGHISVHIQKKNSKINIAVTDTGNGIPQEKQADIFEPFFSTKEKGSGLGLAMTEKLVELNNGEIKLQQSDKNGTTFHIQFKGMV